MQPSRTAVPARRQLYGIGLAAFALLAVPLAIRLSSQPSGVLTILARDGRRALNLTEAGGEQLVALDDLAVVFRLVVREDALGALTVSYRGQTIVLTPNQTLASVAGRLVSLPAPPARSAPPERQWLVPVEFIGRALAPIYDTRLELRKASRLLLVGDVRVPRVIVRYEPAGGSARLTVDATPRTAGTVTQEANHLLIRFDAEALDLPARMPQGSPAFVRGIRVVDPVTLAVDLGPRAGGFRSSSQVLANTMRLIIDLAPTARTDVSQATPPAPVSPPELSGLPQPGASIRTVAIDPGHGGEDEGAQGLDGTKEKDLTLAVARRVKALIEARLGIRVLLTRDGDRSVSLDERTAVANNSKADVFVSLHANASQRSSAAGASIVSAWFDPEAGRAVGTSDAAVLLPTFNGGSRAIEVVPWDLAQIPHLQRSNELARMIERQFRGRVPLASKPVDAAPLRVLESANMPAVLVEMGYLTNADQERLMTGDDFQATIALALYDAVLRFRDASSQRLEPGPGGGER